MLSQPDDAAFELRALASMGLYTIINETVNEKDGGVSGVVLGSIVEFAPDDTPRCVDLPDVAALPRPLGMQLLETIYHFRPALDYEANLRVEFSIHPLKRGYRNLTYHHLGNP